MTDNDQDKDREYKALRGEISQFDQQMAAQDKELNDPPEEIFHYCGAHAALALLRSPNHTMWASNIRFLNDGLEVAYYDELAKTEREDLRRRMPIAGELDAFHNEVADYNKPDHKWHYFAVCFSEVQDDLSQWRAYGDDGRGFCLGFRTSALRLQSPSLTDRTNRALLRVIYDPTQQREMLRFRLTTGLALLEKGHSQGRFEWTMTFPAYINWRSDQFQPQFKHPTWTHEREWRLVRVLGPYKDAGDHTKRIDNLKYRVSGTQIVPYYELLLGRQALSRVIIGPNQSRSLADEAVRLLLDRRRAGPTVKIAFSECSYRRG